MPVNPPRICNRCRKPVTSGRCPCRPAWEGSAWSKGSDRRWRKVRAAKLSRDPMCQHPGCFRLAVEVDHRIPRAAGGAHYDDDNLQSLCADHHAEKTRADAAAGRPRG